MSSDDLRLLNSLNVFGDGTAADPEPMSDDVGFGLGNPGVDAKRDETPEMDMDLKLDLSMGMKPRRSKRMAMDMDIDVGVTDDRTDNFDLSTGQFRDPEMGTFEAGGPPPDYDPGPNRFRAQTGRFKRSPADHFDEPAEVKENSLEPRG